MRGGNKVAAAVVGAAVIGGSGVLAGAWLFDAAGAADAQAQRCVSARQEVRDALGLRPDTTKPGDDWFERQGVGVGQVRVVDYDLATRIVTNEGACFSPTRV
ncbi:MAG: hypothetical protein ACRDO0_07225, partial [Nocardioidaceae bacterium]